MKKIRGFLMKRHTPLRRLTTSVLSIGQAFLLFIVPSVFSQAGLVRENFGPLRSPSSLYQDGTRPLQIERDVLSTPLNEVAMAADEWQVYPFYGGEMLSMAISSANEDIVYVGTRDAGVFKTTNGGISWQPKRNGLTFWPINVLTIDPANENVLYAGTEYAGAWKSSDGGDSWLQVHNGVLDGYAWIVRDIVIDHQNPQVIYIGYYEPYYGGHILKSIDGGASWEYKDSGLPKDEDGDADMVYSLAIDPNNHLMLYAGTWGDGAFRTTDGGESWQAINCGIPDDLGYKYAYVHSFAFDPHHANRLCSILDNDYYIFNTDSCWERISTDGRVDDHIKFHPADNTIMYSYGGFFHISSDGGVTWGYAEENIEDVNDIVFHNGFPDTIYAATEWYGDQWDGYRSGGVYKTTDGATTWEEMTQGITARMISGVDVDPQNSGFLYVLVTQSSDQVLFKSQDGGLTWQTGYHFRFAAIDFITVDPQNPGQLYAGGWGDDFYFSNDDGQTFSTIAEISSPTSMIFDPEAPDTIYVGTSENGIYKSTDSGATWTQKNDGLPADSYDGSIWVDSVAVDPNNSSVIWAGMNVQEGIYKSENGGESWVLKGLDDDFDAHKILSIAINPDNSEVIFAGTGSSGPGSIYRTTNGGATWEQMITDISWVYKTAYDPRNSNRIYAATEGYGVLRSCDGGESWHNYSAGIFYPVLYSLVIIQEAPPLLVAGSYGSGLYWIHPSLENLPPNTPSNPVPADGAGDVPTNQVLGWQGGDPDGDPVTYTVALGTVNPPPVIATGVLTTTYAPNSLAPDTTYYWSITVTDGITTVNGSVWQFTTIPDTPPQAGIVFAPDHNEPAYPGEVLTFTHTLTNTGDITDTFDLTLAGGWGTLLAGTPLTLSAGATATVQARVTVPTGAISGTVNTTRIAATSQLDINVFTSVFNTVTVYTEPIEVCPAPLTDTSIAGPLGVTSTLYIDTLYTFRAVITPTNATEPITYTWLPEPQTGQGTKEVTYRWATPDTYTLTLTAENCGNLLTTTWSFPIEAIEEYFIYLPLVLRNSP